MVNSRPLNPFRRWRKISGPGDSSLIREANDGKKRGKRDKRASSPKSHPVARFSASSPADNGGR